jgi:hypothetical protein
MKGFPRYINTKQDVLNLIEEYPEQTKSFLQSLVDSKMAWVPTGTLAEGDAGTTDSTHKVDESTDGNDVVIERIQCELVEDTNGPIFRLGFASVAEAEALI